MNTISYRTQIIVSIVAFATFLLSLYQIRILDPGLAYQTNPTEANYAAYQYSVDHGDPANPSHPSLSYQFWGLVLWGSAFMLTAFCPPFRYAIIVLFGVWALDRVFAKKRPTKWK